MGLSSRCAVIIVIVINVSCTVSLLPLRSSGLRLSSLSRIPFLAPDIVPLLKLLHAPFSLPKLPSSLD